MPLQSGTTLGPYSVTAKIGEGGMGEVYQARDTKLDRDVALKVLPEAFTADPDRLARFEREAKVLASLNHPNIGSIYGLEEAEGVKALVLELVEGPTLADRIKQGPIPIDEALPIAKQIAEALEAAHEQGVIHRDLKPANVKVKADGTVKVLDFGLAKALDPNPESDPSQSPTLTAAATQMGVIMGTAAYMSPEQARGKPVDKRADIWSFGVVLYELLSGHRVFGKDTVIDTLSAVLENEPEWRLLPDVTPAGARRLLRRCLQKDRRRRCHDIADARIELADLEGESADEGLAAIEQTATSGPRTGVLLPWVLVAVLGIILVSTLWMTRSGSPVPPPATTHLSIDLPPGHSLGGVGGSYPVALSRDGRRLAYVAAAGQASTVGLFLRRLDERTVREVADTEGAGYPFFSPDGESVGFWADGWLQRVPFTGGQPLRIAAVPVLDRGAAWGPDDTIVFASTTEGLQRVSVSGGTPEMWADDGQWPEFIDDGRLLFVSGNEIQVLDLDAPQPQVLYASAEPVRQARMFPPGHLLYGSAGRVIALPINLDTLEVTGTPVVVLESVFEGQFGGAVLFDAAANGTVVFVPGSTQHSLVLVDRSGTGTLLDERRDAYRHPSVSPDGGRLAVTIDADPDPSDTWILDIERGNWRRFTSTGHNLDPHWTPDGSSLSTCTTLARGRGRTRVEPVLRPFGGGDANPLLPDDAVTPLNQCLHSWSPDGSSFLFHEIHPESRLDLWLFDGSGPEPRVEEWLVTPFSEDQARISPSGRWVVYTWTNPGKTRCMCGRSGARATQSSSRPGAEPKGSGGRTDASSSSGRVAR